MERIKHVSEDTEKLFEEYEALTLQEVKLEGELKLVKEKKQQIKLKLTMKEGDRRPLTGKQDDLENNRRVAKSIQDLVDAVRKEGAGIFDTPWLKNHLGISEGATAQRLRKAVEYGLIEKVSLGKYKLK